MIKYSKAGGWTFKGRSIYNPFRILWNLIIFVPYMATIILFSFMLLLATFDPSEVKEFFTKYTPGL